MLCAQQCSSASGQEVSSDARTITALSWIFEGVWEGVWKVSGKCLGEGRPGRGVTPPYRPVQCIGRKLCTARTAQCPVSRGRGSDQTRSATRSPASQPQDCRDLLFLLDTGHPSVRWGPAGACAPAHFRDGGVWLAVLARCGRSRVLFVLRRRNRGIERQSARNARFCWMLDATRLGTAWNRKSSREQGLAMQV